MKRFSQKKLPIYAFIPGQNTHPFKEGGHWDGLEEPRYEGDEKFYKDEFYKYAVDLFNHGFYWEAHVYFEALWNAFERKGEIADFFKGLVQLSASGIKFQQKLEAPYVQHIDRGKELIKPVEGKFCSLGWTDFSPIPISKCPLNGIIYPFLAIFSEN